MAWRDRFEALVRELRARPEITVREATIGPPTDPAEIARAKAIAGAAWPEGMSELYTDLSFVDVTYEVLGSRGNGGAIHIPRVADVWDHAGHEDELWFDWMLEENPEHPFAKVRPIDRFVEEAYAVLYPVPGGAPATVHYHFCGESLVPTGLTFVAWLELLLRARGAMYWLTLPAGRSLGRTWVEENHARIQAIFPDFAPDALRPTTPPEAIDPHG